VLFVGEVVVPVDVGTITGVVGVEEMLVDGVGIVGAKVELTGAEDAIGAVPNGAETVGAVPIGVDAIGAMEDAEGAKDDTGAVPIGATEAEDVTEAVEDAVGAECPGKEKW